MRATEISNELTAVAQLLIQVQDAADRKDASSAIHAVDELKLHAANARRAADDPLWTLASTIPSLGPNFSAVAEVARSADDVATIGLGPLIKVSTALDWENLFSLAAGTDLEPLSQAAPEVSASAHAVRASAERLDRIDASNLLPQVAEPLARARQQLHDVTGLLDVAANAAEIAPGMLGLEAPRSYLLIIQNNAEARASGGIPGALAVLGFDKGKLTLSAQSSAGALGPMSPIVSLDPEQQQIYSGRMGKFMQDVNLTPDFPTAAKTAQTIWERKTKQPVDGVISIDPVALGYILDATGPVTILDPDLLAFSNHNLPTELTGKNVVQTLLSDVYAEIEEPRFQDAYFAGVAERIFAAVSDNTVNANGILKGLLRSTEEGRVLLWSGLPDEQSILAKYPVSGSIAGPSIAPAQFGVYFNDGTGAKMDYHVKRSVKLIEGCPREGYRETTVRITSTNTAPSDAGTSLPGYVTGNGVFGVPPGSVQTNIIAYGPVQAQIESAKVDGKKTNFAPYLHSNRPVGVLAIRLAPGESKTVEYTFGKIVQHTEPDLVVTPTVQPVREVVLPTVAASCS